jgi:Na+-transporting NADH:ubiquinone oxidoreductase subunit NqrB
MDRSASLDPRLFQAGFQLFFLCFGIGILRWEIPAWHLLASIGGCLFFQHLFECLRQKKWLPLGGIRAFLGQHFSVLISAFSLCLLLRTTHWSISLLAAALTVASKYIFRYRGRHLFNPSAFGIIVTLLTQEAWLSPGQWGSGTLLFFLILTLGTIVVTRVQQLDVSLAFLAGYAGLMAWRQLWVLGWPADHFIHTLCTGSLLLFTFFMISDPRTAPAHPVARSAWGFAIGALAFYLAAFRWWYNTPILVLVMAAPLVPLLNWFMPRPLFRWPGRSRSSAQQLTKIKDHAVQA